MDKHLNHLSIRSVLEGIGKQVEDYLFVLVSIYPQIESGLLRFKQEINPVLLGYGIEVFHDLTGERHHINTLHLHLHLLVLYLPEIEYLIDQMQHTVRIAFHNLQLLTNIRRQPLITQDILHRTGNQGQRRAQLMGNIRKKTQFHVRHLLLYGYLML